MQRLPELDTPCHLGKVGEACIRNHVAALFDRGIRGAWNYRLCPVHGGRDASISINPGHTYRAVWNEKYDRCEIDALDIRALLIQRGADESCLGSFGLPKAPSRIAREASFRAADPGMLADAGRAHAISKLPMDLPGHLYKMCVQAILDGPGDLAGNPDSLLDRPKEDFIDLGMQCGFDRSYMRKLWKQRAAL